MEKNYYIIPTIKVKEIETESLMQTMTVTDDEPIEEGTQVESKPLYGDFNVWEK